MSDQSASAGWLQHWLRFVVHRRWLVLAAMLLVTAAAALAARHLGVNTDPISLLSADLPFIADYNRLRAEFPELDRNLLLAVEAPTPEQARAAAERLSMALAADPEHFPAWYWPAGEPWLNRHGLLLQSTEQLQAAGDALSRAQPLLARLAGRPDVPALFAVLGEAAEKGDEIGLELDTVYQALAAVLEQAGDDRGAWLSWQRLLAADDPDEAREVAREIILVTPRLDYGRVRPGRAALTALRDLRRDLGLTNGAVRLKITGSVALADEELQSALAGAQRAGWFALLMVGTLLWVALRSPVLVAFALFTLLCGLALAAGVAVLAVGRINLISLAFVVLYIGLGVNYALHFLLRYRERLAAGESHDAAMIAAGGLLWRPLLLSALTTAIGFFSFIPTAYAGVGELGLIAGLAMFVALTVSYTLLPALLAIVPAVPSGRPVGRRWSERRWLDVPLHHRRLVLVLAGIAAVAAWWVARDIAFDGDPLSIRDPRAESVVTIRALMANGEVAHRNLQVLAPSAAEARRLSDALAALPGVQRVVSLLSFLPADQDEKLAMLDDLRWTIDPDLLAGDWIPVSAPANAQRSAALALAAVLDRPADPAAGRLAAALQGYAARLQSPGGEALAGQTTERLLAALAPVMHRLAAALAVDRPVTLDEVRRVLGSHWVSPAGEWLIQIFPQAGGDHQSLAPLVAAVRAIAPNATGAPVIQLAAAGAISNAFRLALLLATASITGVLLLVLRTPREVLHILAPLAIGGGLTLAAMVAGGIAFNFANVIALPLLLGVAVDNGIHLVLRHREGRLAGGNVLRSATARGIVFGALTTAVGFGNLVLSPHAGTASLGLVLAFGLLLMVAVTLTVLPASLGPATAASADDR